MDVSSPKIRYDRIDGLRAFSAIGIVLLHVLTNGDYGLAGFVFVRLIPSFTDLVYLFMVVSGFSMCCGYYDKIVNARITPAQFYSKRFKKVWPFFALLCLMDLAISPSLNSLYEFIANLTLCFGLLPEAEFSVIGVGWFLGLVFAFYLLFPFFCYLLENKRRAWISFAATLVMNYLCGVYLGASRINIVYHAVFFLAGGMIYLYRDPLSRFADRYGGLLLLLVGVTIVLYFTVGARVRIILLLCSLMLIYALRQQGCKYSVLSNPVVRFLSSISLEIYLSHMVIFRLLEKLGLICLTTVAWLDYVLTALGTIAGTIVFVTVIRKGFEFIGKRMKK